MLDFSYMNECEICPIVQTNENDAVIIDGVCWRVALDPNQEYLGKCFVTLKKHKDSLSDLMPDDWVEFSGIVNRLESAITTAFKPTHFNWSCLMNNAIRDKQPTHVHWHCQPRYKNPKIFANLTFTDPRWPLSARSVNEKLVNRGVLDQIASEISLNLR